MINTGNDWTELLAPETEKDYYQAMRKTLAAEYRQYRVYPHMNDIFNALRRVAHRDVKAVILGQDPYHGPGQAHGLSFSVQKGVAIPPSLRNIYKELQDDLGICPPEHGDLTGWADGGALLLNAVLTVREGQPNSHAAIGWQRFTDRIIELLNERGQTVVFLLWGRNAKAKQALVTNPRHRILTAAHPSPLSAYNGFFGCGHFSKCNQILANNDIQPINWQLYN